MYCRMRTESVFYRYSGMAVIIMLLLCIQFQPSISATFTLHPQDTAVLIGRNATFTCDVENGAELDWVVFVGDSNTSISTTSYPANMRLTDLGISWIINDSLDGSNGTIIIPGTEVTNCTTLMCRDTATTVRGDRFSTTAKLIVLGAPSPPEPTAVLLNTTFHISWNEPFTWPNHSISGYAISAELVTAPKGMEVQPHTQLPHTTNSFTVDGSSYDVCTEVLFEVTATNDLGESLPGNVTAGIPRVPGSDIQHDPNISVDLTFSQDLTPMVEITFKLPSICSFQEEQYDIAIFEINGTGAGDKLVHTSSRTYRGNSTTFIATETVMDLSKDKLYSFSVTTPRGVFSAIKEFNTTLIISSPTTEPMTFGEGDEGPPYIYIGIGVGAFVVLLLLVLVVCCAIMVCKLCCGKNDEKNTKKNKSVDSTTWDSFLTNQNDILRQARAENPRTASTYESIDEYQEKAMFATRMQQLSLDQKSSSLDRYQKHPMQQVPPPAVPDRRHSREESPYTAMGSAPSTLQNKPAKHDHKNQPQGSPQHPPPSVYPNLETAGVVVVVPNNDEARVSGGSAGYFSSASGGEDVNAAYDHIAPMDPLTEQTKQDLSGASFIASQDEGHFVQTEC